MQNCCFMRKNILLFIFICLLHINTNADAQRAYFADGYHGGIYGHYPMWNTQFMVDKLAQHPEWKIHLEIEPETWDSVFVKEPAAYNNFKKITTDSRVEFTNPTYAQPYCFNISGESLIRQFEYGIKKIHQHFPDVKFTTYSAEEPCFTSSLPRILQSFGFKYAVLKNPDTCWGGYTSAYGGELVNWVGPDGTTMLSVPRYECEQLEENSTWQTAAWNNSEKYLKTCWDYKIEHPVGMCYQDVGWRNGPWIGSGENIKNNSQYITWTDYIENISVGKTSDNWNFSQEDVLVSLMWGSQVMQRIAQEVRASENRIVMAEKMAVMGHLEQGLPYPEPQFEEAWRTLMLAQHHDSWIVPYNELKKGKTWADYTTIWTNNTNAIADEIVGNTIQQLNGTNNDGSGNLGYIRVFNTLGIKRTEVVVIDLPPDLLGKSVAVYNSQNNEVASSCSLAGNRSQLTFAANVPSFGYTTYSLREKTPKPQKASNVRFDKQGNCILENDMYKIVIDTEKGGIIKSLIAKKVNNKEFANVNDRFGLGEIRGFFYEEEKFHSSAEQPAKITVLKDNALETSIRIEGEIASHPFTQTIHVASGQKPINFDLTINWKQNVGIGEYKQGDNWRDNRRAFYDDRFKLNVLFPTNLRDTEIYKNAPFDVGKSRHQSTFFNTWDSIKHNIILHWVDLAQKDEKYGLALLSDHTTSYSHGEGYPLGLTAQYSGKGLWGPDYKITKPLKMKYAIIPHAGNWDEAGIATESNMWNEPLVASFSRTSSMQNKSYIEMAHSGYEITAAREKDKAIIIRLYNAEGNENTRNITFNFPVKKVEEIELDGRFVADRKIEHSGQKYSTTVSIPRFGIKTLKITRN